MPARAAPSMPTARQIADALKAVREHCPDARVARVGPNGVEFDYPERAGAEITGWQGKPFG